MTIDERKDKLKTLPWQALYDLAVKKEVDETEIARRSWRDRQEYDRTRI